MTALSTDAPEEILAVQRKARNSSFYSAMRLMPRAEREAMFAIYAFCRAVDDIADDGEGSRADRREALARWRLDLEALYGRGDARLSAFLKDAVRRYGLRKEDFLSVIDGMEMDVADDIRAPELAMLDLYCDRVASAVGRLSIKVFGMEEEPGFRLAKHLGRALQLTNILRDLDEDAAMGRLYLAREHLEEAGIFTRDPNAAIADPRIDAACRACARLAHAHYREADAVMQARPRGRIRTPRLMGRVYAEILKAMEVQGWKPPRVRVSLPKTRLAAIVLRHGILG